MSKKTTRTNTAFLLGSLLTLFAFVAFFWNYTNPPYLYWDENYHIASAQKYLHNVYFMEPHPPLGKMLIAAGEALFDANEEDDQFIGTDYARQLPGGFSFKGYRFFPVLLGWLIAPLLYLVFLSITKKPIWAFLLGFLYVFDNALITHSRAAMLDSTMLFFCVAMIAVYFKLMEYKDNKHGLPILSILFGIAFAGAMATKALALIMILLVPAILIAISNVEMQKIRNAEKLSSSAFLHYCISALHWSRIIQFLTLSVASFLIVYLGIWYLHFSMGTRVIPSLPDNGYYQASQEYKTLIAEQRVNLPVMLRDSLVFLGHYSEGVPTLNLCKADENGSPFFFWPLGARSINYRWETPDGTSYRYITLQANPAVWWTAFAGVLLAFIVLIGSWVLPNAKPLTYKWQLLFWVALWTSYMLAVSQIDRVMYLYHYFIPLIFSFIILAYVFMELTQLGAWKLTDERKNWVLLGFGALVFITFQFFSPLTYYRLLQDDAFKRRMLFPLWDLHCIQCEDERLMATPISCEGDE